MGKHVSRVGRPRFTSTNCQANRSSADRMLCTASPMIADHSVGTDLCTLTRQVTSPFGSSARVKPNGCEPRKTLVSVFSSTIWRSERFNFIRAPSALAIIIPLLALIIARPYVSPVGCPVLSALCEGWEFFLSRRDRLQSVRRNLDSFGRVPHPSRLLRREGIFSLRRPHSASTRRLRFLWQGTASAVPQND